MAKRQPGGGSSKAHQTSSKRSPAGRKGGSPKPAPLPPGRVAGKKFVFTGKLVGSSYGYGTRQAAEAFVTAEGGQVMAELDAGVDYLVVGATRGSGPSGAEKKALQLNQKKGASIQVLDEQAFLALFTFTADEIVALLESGAAGLQRLQTFRYPRLPIPRIDMRGSRLRSVPVQGGEQSLDLTLLQLDHTDLRGWIADRVHLQPITGSQPRRSGGDQLEPGRTHRMLSPVRRLLRDRALVGRFLAIGSHRSEVGWRQAAAAESDRSDADGGGPDGHGPEHRPPGRLRPPASEPGGGLPAVGGTHRRRSLCGQSGERQPAQCQAEEV